MQLSEENIEQAFVQIEDAVTTIFNENCLPFVIGGDGAIGLPQMRALHKKHGEIAIVHIDAHTDAWPIDSNTPFTNANQFTHAITEGLIDQSAALHIGTRGPVTGNAAIKHARDMGYEVIAIEQYFEKGVDKVVQYIHQLVADKPVFICYDMEFFLTQ